MVDMVKVVVYFDSSSIEILICSLCKSFLQEDFDFCPYCGQVINTEIAQKNEHVIDLRSEELKAADR